MDGKNPHQIFIHILEARGVTAKDTNHTSDPHCVVTVGPTSRLKEKTQSKFNTVNCQWNETFVFENVMLSDEEYGREKVGRAPARPHGRSHTGPARAILGWVTAART